VPNIIHPSSFLRTVTATLLIGAGIFIGRYLIPVQLDGQAQFQLVSVSENRRQLAFPTFWEALDTLHENYIESVDDRDLFYGAVEGLVAAAGDPYTVFSNPEETKQFQETLSGSFSGIGVEIGVKNGLVTVISPLDNSPADQAGIREGDVIAGVDGQPVTLDQNIDDVVQKIRGRRGEEVKLSVLRKDEEEAQDISIIRDTITIESVKTVMQDGVAHIRLSSFNGDSSEQFAGAVRDAIRQNVRGVILDVRSNPGGFLQTSVDIAGHFLDPGTVVVSEKGPDNDKVYKTKGNPSFRDIPVAVLINGGSASASEIVAGALQEQAGADLIGQKTFGKGSVQELITLSDGSSLRVTVAKWFTPNGRSISDEGIEPTIQVENNRETDNDEQLDRAREQIRQRIENP